jgi:hypothetical protein
LPSTASLQKSDSTCDEGQSDALRALFMHHIIENYYDKGTFEEAYIRLFLTWHASRYEIWLTVLNIPQSSSQGSKSAARAPETLEYRESHDQICRIRKRA